MTLPYNLPLGDTTYNTTYVTTNGTLTFGTPDATFSSYPYTPSISLAGWDWVTWSGGHLSYGVTSTGFCAEWVVRPFPQSSGAFTTIKLTVDTSRLPTWSGIVETTGWLPADLRRGIRFNSGEDVVTISEAFTINGGRPVEMQTCWDNSIIPMSATCPVEPPPGQCWDGSTVAYNQTCPPVPPDTQCWDGSWVSWSQTCAPEPQPITCWNGTVIPYNQTCPATPPDIVCWDNSTVPWNGTCSPEPEVVCWDNSVVHYQSECSPTPPDIVCWNGEVVPWNGTCQQVPPPVDCWDGSSVNWNEQCPVRTLNSPQNITAELRTNGVYVSWDAPIETLTNVERYAVSWQCEGCANYGWSSTNTSVLIPFSTFNYTGGLGLTYTFSVRADNDTTSTYSSNVVGPTILVQVPSTIYPDGAVKVSADEGWGLRYEAPLGMRISEVLFASYGNPVDYQYGTCHATNSMQLVQQAVNNNVLQIPASNNIFGDPCGGTYKKLSVVLTIEVDPNYVAPTPEPTPTDTVTPTPEPTVSPEPTPTPEPTEEPSPTPSPQPTETPDPKPTSQPTPEPKPSKEPIAVPVPTPSETSSPEPTPTPEPSIEPVQEVLNNASSDGVITEEETQAIVDNLLSDGDLSTSEVADLVDNLQSDGQLTEEEKQLVTDVLVEAYADTAIPADVFAESGLDYEDLPPEQPITLDNGVIITAEVADAIEIFENPSEMLATVFTDPSKALKAISNVGADMTPTTRKEAQAVTVSAVVVTQVIAGTSALTLARK